MVKTFLCACLIGLLTAVGGRAADPVLKPGKVAGKIFATRIEGTVMARDTVTGVSRELKEHDPLTEKTTVTTSVSSSVVLVFSNGATIDLGPDTSLNIEEFQQDPFGEDVKASDIKTEHGTSKTKLDLIRGELVGKVAHLNTDEGSEFTVQTPVGAAGIRGTTFQIFYHVSKDGRITFTIKTAEGVVVFRGSTQETGGTDVPGGKKVTVEVNPSTTAGATPTVTLTNVSATEAAAIQTVVQEIIAATPTVIFTAPTPSTNSSTTNSSSTSTTSPDSVITPPATDPNQ